MKRDYGYQQEMRFGDIVLFEAQYFVVNVKKFVSWLTDIVSGA